MVDWSDAFNHIVRPGRRSPRRPVIDRLSVRAPKDLDEQVSHIRPWPGWIRVPLVIAVAVGAWAAVIAVGVAVFRLLFHRI